MLNTDCWIVAYKNTQNVDISIKYNIHEVLFLSNTKSKSTMTKITACFQNKYIGDSRRRVVAREVLL